MREPQAVEWTTGRFSTLFYARSKTLVITSFFRESKGTKVRVIMSYYGHLNDDSMQRIRNIENGFRSYPAYASYTIRNYCYDVRGGIQALEVSKNGQSVNLYLFYPSENGTGKIGSIALYGSFLQGHYNAMHNSMMAFGMPISDISIEYGQSEFIDIYLNY